MRRTVCFLKQFTPKSEKKEDTEVERSDDNKRGQRKAGFETHTCLVWRQFMTPDTSCSSLFFLVLSFQLKTANFSLTVISSVMHDSLHGLDCLPRLMSVSIDIIVKLYPRPSNQFSYKCFSSDGQVLGLPVHIHCNEYSNKSLPSLASSFLFLMREFCMLVLTIDSLPSFDLASTKSSASDSVDSFPVLLLLESMQEGLIVTQPPLCVSRESIRDFRQSIDCLIGSLFSSRVWFLNEIE